MNLRVTTRFSFFMLACQLFSTVAFSAELEPYHDDGSATFLLSDLKGNTHTLSDYKGKVVLVNFWASWCLPCLLEMPSMSRLTDTLNNKDFEIVTINISDTAGRIRETLKRLQVDLLVLQDLDSKIFKTWNGRILPTSYLLDHTGQIRYRAVGPINWVDVDVLLKIKKLIQQQ